MASAAIRPLPEKPTTLTSSTATQKQSPLFKIVPFWKSTTEKERRGSNLSSKSPKLQTNGRSSVKSSRQMSQKNIRITKHSFSPTFYESSKMLLKYQKAQGLLLLASKILSLQEPNTTKIIRLGRLAIFKNSPEILSLVKDLQPPQPLTSKFNKENLPFLNRSISTRTTNEVQKQQSAHRTTSKKELTFRIIS